VTGATRVPMAVVLATAGPVCVALVLLVAFVAGDALGYSPLRYQPPQNIAEAAALASASDVLRRLRAGEDPAALITIRPEVISSSVTKVTALEAAIWGRTVEIVRLLDREGAIPAERKAYLACLSQALQANELLEYLAPHGTSGCDANAVMESIQARSTHDQ